MSQFIVIEMVNGDGENRPLGISGDFLVGPQFSDPDVKKFATPAAARLAADQATNRRPGTTLFVPGEKKAVAA